MTSLSRLRNRRRAQRAMTLTDALLAILILGFSSAGVLAMIASASRTADRRTLENSLGAAARTSLDEMLRELRAASQISDFRTIGATTCRTDTQNIVFMAPGYDQVNGILLDTFDVVAFVYNRNATNPALSTLTETTLVAEGSHRPLRTNFVLAENVQSVVYTYRVREYFVVNPDEALSSVTLKTQPQQMPLVSLGDMPVSITGTTPSTTVTFVSAITATTEPKTIQVTYTIDPLTNPGGLTHVNGVDAMLTLAERGGRARTVSITLAGNARLRNKRI